MKLIITGYADHGKDTVCSFIEQIYELYSVSSSYYSVMYTDIFTPLLIKTKLSKGALHEQRDKYRKEFFDIIKNANDKNGLDFIGKGIFEEYSIYNGIRNDEEFFALKEKRHFDHSIWVDASKRKPIEQSASCTMKPEYCDFILDNNGNKAQLVQNILNLINSLYRKS